MRPQAVRRRTRADWRGLAITCTLWALGLAVSVTIVYTIATIPAGWWIEVGLPWQS